MIWANRVQPLIAYNEMANNSPANVNDLLLWDMMVHVVNHGTQHRSEAAMALTELGRSPGDLDYMYFEYARS